MTKKEREELNAMSVKAFGKVSKWKQVVEDGEFVTVEAIGNQPRHKKQVHVSVEEIKERMNRILQTQIPKE